MVVLTSQQGVYGNPIFCGACSRKRHARYSPSHFAFATRRASVMINCRLDAQISEFPAGRVANVLLPCVEPKTTPRVVVIVWLLLVVLYAREWWLVKGGCITERSRSLPAYRGLIARIPSHKSRVGWQQKFLFCIVVYPDYCFDV